MKSRFEHLEAPADTVSERLKSVDLPSLDQVRALADWDATLLEKFERTVEQLPGDRSGALAELSYAFAEHGWSDEQIYVGIEDADTRWGKFVGRTNRDSILTDLVNRARAKVGYRTGDPTEGIRATIARLEGAGHTPEDSTFTWTSFRERRYEVVWQLEGLMPVQSVGLLVAPPGTGKTQMLMHIGAEMARGADSYLTWRNMGQVQHRVLFLSFEMGPHGVHLFLSIMDGAYPEAQDQERLGRNFFLEPVGEKFPLDLEAGQQWLDQKLEKLQPDLVLIDSLSMIVSKEMVDEVAAKDMFSFLSTMRKKHDCSMLIVHHDRKRSNEGGKAKATLDDIYGSRFITASVDYALYLEKDGKGDDQLSLSMLKNRYAKADHKDELIRTGNLTFIRNGAGMQAVADNAEKMTVVEEDPFA